MQETRVDRWLWAIRLFKTRTMATDACRAGHIRINGAGAKPASPVRVGDRVSVRGGARERRVEVVELIDKRVGAPVAAACFIDHSPPPPPRDEAAPLALRDHGRPTKRDRRKTDRLRGR